MTYRVLVVDDTRFMRKMLRDILEKFGHEVVGEAENGNAGIQKYKELKPDIIFMDISMPEIDGVEAVRRIKAFDPSAVVIICSAMSQQEQISEALKVGAVGYIMKPFKPEKVNEVIFKYASQHVERNRKKSEAHVVQQAQAALTAVKVQGTAAVEGIIPDPNLQQDQGKLKTFIPRFLRQDTKLIEEMRKRQEEEERKRQEEERKRQEEEARKKKEEEARKKEEEERKRREEEARKRLEEEARKKEEEERKRREEEERLRREEEERKRKEEEERKRLEEEARKKEEEERKRREEEERLRREEEERKRKEEEERKRREEEERKTANVIQYPKQSQEHEVRGGNMAMNGFTFSYVCNWSEEINGEVRTYKATCTQQDNTFEIEWASDQNQQAIQLSVDGFRQLSHWFNEILKQTGMKDDRG